KRDRSSRRWRRARAPASVPRATRAVSRVPFGVGPCAERMRDETDVVIAAQLGDFLPKPRRARKSRALAVELELGHHEPRVVAVELVDFPCHSAVLHEMPRLLDERPFREREQLACLAERDRILVL